MDPDNTNKRISTTTKSLMMGVALFVDFIELLISFTGIGLFTGAITTTFSWILFMPWFWMHGVSFTRTAHMRTTALWYILGWIPLVGTLPEFTLGVYRNIRIAENEDKEKQKEAKRGGNTRTARTNKKQKSSQNRKQTPRYSNTS